MEAFDLDNYLLCQQLLFGDTQAGTSTEEEAAAEAEAEGGFFQFQSPQAPMLGGVGDQMVINPAGFVDGGGSTLPPLQMPGGGGIWAGNGDGFVPGGGNWAGNGDGFVPGGGSWAVNGDEFIQGGGNWAGNGDEFIPGGGNWAVDGGLQATGEAWAAALTEDPLMQFSGEQLMHGGGVPILPGSMQELLMSDADLSELVSDEEVLNSLLLMSGYSSDLPQVNAGPTEMMPQMSTMEYPQPQADVQQAVPDDNETAEVAQMVRVAVDCGDEMSTTWSEEEDQLLLQGLSQFADQDSITKCFNIAFGLPKKTAHDVALRIRWLSELEKMIKAAKQAEARPEIPARRKITKAKDCPEYFYYVKTNMDALHNK
ncbi:hypothetical protein BRADI_1g77952v3 [Brachypodium distachyon]|uniref:Myb-like domain-containing protein n=1 Tax=Brachypodium distachyon TaxID=15368 RepID=A0A2K2DVP3_BRADI|nr:hypothetical protein BRADI_1g77952v3 [Brachypodium distachyon]